MVLTNFWSPVKSADQIWCDVIVSNMWRRTKVTQLQDGLWLVHLLKTWIEITRGTTTLVILWADLRWLSIWVIPGYYLAWCRRGGCCIVWAAWEPRRAAGCRNAQLWCEAQHLYRTSSAPLANSCYKWKIYKLMNYAEVIDEKHTFQNMMKMNVMSSLWVP